MKTFKQYLTEFVSKYDSTIEYFKAEPFRFGYILPKGRGFLMKRNLNIADLKGEEMFVSYNEIGPDSLTYVSYPNVLGARNSVSLSKTGKILNQSFDEVKTQIINIIKRLDGDTYLEFVERYISVDVNYPNRNPDFYFGSRKPFFEIYNVYENTPGSKAEKTVAAAQFLGMDRSDILRLKHKYGLLKSDELSDKDTLDLF